jgi:hypothetical protein
MAAGQASRSFSEQLNRASPPSVRSDTEGGSPRTTTFRGEIQWAVFLPDGKSYIAAAGLVGSITPSTQKVATLVRWQALPKPIM